MNIDRLKAAERDFLAQYPDGFEDESLTKIAKRHNMSKHIAFAQEHLGPHSGSAVDKAIANIVLLVSRSSMVSFFEKPKFKDLVERLDSHQKAFLVDSVLTFLHGDQQGGFEGVVDILRQERLARWSLTTIIPAYYAPNDEVFVKPTTAKGVLAGLEVNHLVYKPQPTWAFYAGYRALIDELKPLVDPRLSPSNAAFTGFLMMTIV